MEHARQLRLPDYRENATASHEFVDKGNPQLGGYWRNASGEVICSWEWDELDRKLTITCGKASEEIYPLTIPPERLRLKALTEFPARALEAARGLQALSPQAARW